MREEEEGAQGRGLEQEELRELQEPQELQEAQELRGRA